MVIFSSIISGIIALAGTIVAGVQSKKSRESQKKMAKEANQMAREDWKEQMELEEKKLRSQRAAGSIASFQDMVNKSDYLKQSTRQLWAGTRR